MPQSQLPRTRRSGSHLAQGNVVGGPIRHSVPLLRDVMTAILVRFEWHGDSPGSGTGPSSYTVHLSPPTTDPCNKAHAPAQAQAGLKAKLTRTREPSLPITLRLVCA